MIRWLLILSLGALLGACDSHKPLDRVHQAQQNVDSSESLEEWHQNRERLRIAILENWEEALNDPHVCRTLLELPASDLLTLHEEILLVDAGQLPCREALLGQIERFLANISQPVFRSTDWPQLNPCDSPRRTLGPSQTVIVDTTNGPRFVTGDLPKCTVAFTFDDGPHAAYTDEVLTHLSSEQVGAVFFQVGYRIKRFPDISEDVARAGHVLANHSWSHPNMPKLSLSQGIKEITDGFFALLDLNAPTSPFFRFPFGAFTRSLRSFLVKNHVSEFFWNMDTLDWKIKDPKSLYVNVLKEIEREKRGILLFHDVHPQTVAILPALFKALKKAGYQTAQFVPQQDLAEFPND